MKIYYLFPLFAIFLGVLFLLFTCHSSDNNKTYINSQKIGDNLFVETYQTYHGGVYDGDAYDIYLTDSLSFRKKLGNYDDHDWPDVTIRDDRVVVKWNDYQLLRNRVRNCKVSSLKEKGYDDLLDKPYAQ